ncbi:MAG TPA: GNAT family N-acetyltransferase [Acidimicrobiaceae bacterium]|nr:GNAT family N-acetyltransferase [Acidimicrobiaceae bacterium]HCB36819.1 GNAT family N-acetyltransferase [Acidimicrobiaceae bacterium]
MEVCRGDDSSAVAEAAEALARLLPQLSRSAAAPTPDQVSEIAGHDACTLLLARLPPEQAGQGARGRIVGALVLVRFPLPTGQRAWIEDVVVDESARGRGVGELLNRHAVALAAEAGARTVDLTSRPGREAANRLYRRLGFAPRDTNVYRLDLD